MENITSVTQKGQVTIPVAYRRLLGISPKEKVKFFYEPKSKELKIVPLGTLSSLRGIFKTNKKYNKKKARELFYKDLARGKV